MDTRLAHILRSAGQAFLSSLLSSAKRTPVPSTTRTSTRSRQDRSGSHAGASQQTHADGSTPPPLEDAATTHVVQLTEALTHVSYDPNPDGDADPGEVVWAWIPYEEDTTRGKDRPAVVLGRSNGGVLVAQMTSKDHDRDAIQEAHWGRYWLDVGTGDWDPKHRPSEVRLDRVLWVPLDVVRREGATLPRSVFESVVTALKKIAKA